MTVRSIRPNDTVSKTVIKVTSEIVDLHEGRRLFRGCAIKALIYEQGDSFRTSVKTFSFKVNHRETNFIIGGFLAGLHRSPLICLCFQDLLATFGSVEDSFSPLIIQALSVGAVCGKVLYIEFFRF